MLWNNLPSLLPLPKKRLSMQALTSTSSQQVDEKQTRRSRIKNRAMLFDSDSEDEHADEQVPTSQATRTPATEQERHVNRLLLTSLEQLSRLCDAFSLCDGSSIATTNYDVTLSRVTPRDCSVSPGFADDVSVDRCAHARESRLDCADVTNTLRCMSVSQTAGALEQVRAELCGPTFSSQVEGVAASAEMSAALDLFALPVDDVDAQPPTEEWSQERAR